MKALDKIRERTVYNGCTKFIFTIWKFTISFVVYFSSPNQGDTMTISLNKDKAYTLSSGLYFFYSKVNATCKGKPIEIKVNDWTLIESEFTVITIKDTIIEVE